MAEKSAPAGGALDDIRVIDLSGPSGIYCTKLLADLGADVIRIEPPEGDPLRRIGPFYHNEPDQEKSLLHYHFNTNKRSITLNLQSDYGWQILKQLTESADLMVESFKPGYMAEKGLGFEDIRKINPKLILVSITGFGQTGPYHQYKATDLVAQAVSGVLYTMGFPDDPPTSLGGSQAYHMASANAAIGALIALYYRDASGQGQHVDISMQATALRMSEMAPFTYWIKGVSRGRTGLEYYRSLKDNFVCKDGRVVCSALGGAGADRMLEWMTSEGMASDLNTEKYTEVIGLIKKATIGDASTKRLQHEFVAEVRHIEEVWQDFLKTHTREELFVGAQTRKVRLFPVNDAKSVVEDIGLKKRNYFIDVEHPELEIKLKYPGPPYRLSRTPWRIKRRAPLVGEHNLEIYCNEMQYSEGEINSLKEKGII